MALTAITVEGSTLDARNVKLMQYGQTAKRGRNLVIPYRDGEWSHNPKWFAGTNLVLEVVLQTTPSPEENLSKMLGLFNQAYDLATLAGTHPYAGSVQCQVEMLRPPVQSAGNPNVYRVALRNPDGVWENVTATTTTGSVATPAAITTTGDRPVSDFSLRFAATGTITHTDSAGVAAAVTLTAGASTGVTVDMGNRTILSTTGGSEDAFATFTQPYWMRFESGSTQALVATADHTFTWRNKYAV